MSIVFTIEDRYLRNFGDKSYLSQKIKGYLHKLIILLYSQPTQHQNMILKKLTP